MINSRTIPALALLWAGLCIHSNALAQRDLKSIPDPDPEIERKSFQVADGFEVELFAGDPLLAKPIQMNFDARGRLWVASSEVYPQIEPGQVANDKILILEDVDGDGKADKTTVFQDGLLIPTGVEPGDGGAYVANSTELLQLKDTDGDGKADERRVVLSGFGTEDTHHILHTLRWGWDGNLYMNQSIYIHSHIETPHGVRRLNGGGIWRFRPDTLELDVFMRGLVNTWGHHYDRFGQSFATDGAGGEGINYVLPGAYYVTAVDAVRVLRGLNPGSPKHCGLEIVGGSHLPENWQGNFITNDFRGNRVCRFIVSEDGAGFASREQAELIKSRHQAFRPIDVKLGPDGAIYIADWYNPIIQHGEVDFRDPRRDHTHGRIWRVTAKGRKTTTRPNLVGMSTEGLLDQLRSPEPWNRHFAKRVLAERGATEVIPALAAWVAAIPPNASDREQALLEALWTHQTVDVVERDLLVRLLTASDPNVRAAAVRVLRAWKNRVDDPIGLLAARVADDHPRVRLEAVRVLGEIPSVRSAELALSALDRPMDQFLDYALWLTARDLQATWLPAVSEGRFDDGGKPARLVFALDAVGSPEVVKPLLRAIESGALTREARDRALVSIASLGGPDDLRLILDQAVDGRIDAARRSVLLQALVRAHEQRKIVPSGDLARLSSLLHSTDGPTVAAAARLAGAWKLTNVRERLLDLIRADSGSDVVRQSAIAGLAAFGGADALRDLATIAGSDAPASTRFAAAARMVEIAPEAGAAAAAGLLAQIPEGDATELFAAHAERTAAGNALAKALAGKTIPADRAKLGIRIVSTAGRPNAGLIEALNRAGGLGGKGSEWTPARREALLAAVLAKGDPARGEQVFRRKSSQCLQCHAIAGAGGQVGPGLESIGGSAQIDYLLDSLIEPNKQVKENYHALVVATDDGKVRTGIKIREGNGELVLRDSEDREIAIPLASIEERKMGASIMPAGLIDTLTDAELTDLVRFLSELGKVGSYSVSKTPTARRWEALLDERELARRIHGNGMDAMLGDTSLRWSPVYATVAGTLPASDLPVIPGLFGIPARSVVRTSVEVSTPGRVRFAIEPASELTVWVDGNRVDPRPTFDLDLERGSHSIAFSFNRDASKPVEAVKLELVELPGSSAKAQLLLGK